MVVANMSDEDALDAKERFKRIKEKILKKLIN